MSPVSYLDNVTTYALGTTGGLRFVVLDENTYAIGEADETYLTDYTIRSFSNLGDGYIAAAVMYEEDANIQIIERSSKSIIKSFGTDTDYSLDI